MVETPVLFETFVRVDYARQVWDAIKAAQPKKLYFYSNKGREEKEGEIENNDEIRSWIKEIDWDCDLHTWFREECVDVYTSLRGAISWLFENEEAGIILEDDCVPTMAFFSFCDQLLPKFESDKRVWMLSGDNYLSYSPYGYDYIFSHMFQIYGWATWRDRWESTDWDLKFINEYISQNKLEYLFPNKKQRKDRERVISSALPMLNRTKCWDGIFHYNMLMNNAMCIFPKSLLVTNVGLVGVHNNSIKRSAINNIATFSGAHYPISNEPLFPIPDSSFEHKMYQITWKRKGIVGIIAMKIHSLIQSLYESLSSR